MTDTGLWWEDPDESPEDVAKQLREARESLTPEQRKDLAAFLVDGDEPAKEDDGAQRWQQARAGRQSATPEASGHQPQSPAPADDFDGQIAAEVKHLRDTPGASWSKYLALKQEAAMRQQAG